MTAASPAVPPSPLPDERKALLERLVDGLDAPSLWWLSGYTAGLAQGHPPRSLAVLPGGQVHVVAHESQRLTVLYGSQTGNARRQAEQLAAEAEAAGVSVRLLRADAYPTRELASERLLYVVISTQGEGDPPDDAIGLVEFLSGRRAPKLPELKYAVLGLGDSSYADFCGIARRIDERLAWSTSSCSAVPAFSVPCSTVPTCTNRSPAFFCMSVTRNLTPSPVSTPISPTWPPDSA